VTLSVLRSLWQAVQKSAGRGLAQGGSHEADRLAFHDHPLVRGGVQPGSVGWDCRCGAPLGGVRSRGHQRPIWLSRLEGEGHREGAALIVTVSCFVPENARSRPVQLRGSARCASPNVQKGGARHRPTTKVFGHALIGLTIQIHHQCKRFHENRTKQPTAWSQ
jgi:hypothetical protein